MILKRWWRKRISGKPIVVVSGLPRSGTSMLMQMLAAGGVDTATDQVRTADEDNPKGYFELERIKNLQQETDKSWLKSFRGKGIKVISFLLRDLPEENFYKVIFCERDLDEVLRSQNKMLVHRGEPNPIPDSKMKENYRSHIIRAKWFLTHQAHCEALFLKHGEVLTNPEQVALNIASFLAMNMDTKAMAAVVDPKLYRNRSSNQ